MALRGTSPRSASSNQATALIKLHKLAHLDITVAPHSNLNFSRIDFASGFSECVDRGNPGEYESTKSLEPDL
ncbi:hypothetical protein TNCT_530381 [Trichonephila clavata]|uniref:Uncharacterized protein n=1 Tax=Trichonephila clavata TaxID=2740835 RepID=A0A8X6FCT8_TRICU|nr:hypothetical protein TNCT_530381 [Trichonephila clavata]